MYKTSYGWQKPGLEEGGGLITASESSKSSDMLYSKASSSDEEEELISASASDSRDRKTIFSNGGRTAIGAPSLPLHFPFFTSQKPYSHGMWLGKPRVTRVLYLWIVVGGIPTSRVIPTARGLVSLESLEVRTCGLWSAEF
ncbi:hypothetical protein AVEN_84323-1 [Araneus ventricosus]|uniref:Uncharacterized protein n=1 Tax=Araneus ventricosus TaxID=182803 RepID=A0A4Y2PG97_ARAVE|nr:hypothetical protein AVEN_84323-1 [Araneus ventricosus]